MNCLEGLMECARGVRECAGCHPGEGLNSCNEGLRSMLGETHDNFFWLEHHTTNAASLIECDILMNITVTDDSNGQIPNFYLDGNGESNQLTVNCSGLPNGYTFGTYGSGDSPYPPPAEGQPTGTTTYAKYKPDKQYYYENSTGFNVDSSRNANSDYAASFNTYIRDAAGTHYAVGADSSSAEPGKLNFWIKLSNFKVYSPFNVPMMTITDDQQLAACTMHYKLDDGTTGIYDYDILFLFLPEGDFNYWSVNLKRLCLAKWDPTAKSHTFETPLFNSSDQLPQYRVPEMLVNIPTIYLGQGSKGQPFTKNNWWVGGGASDVPIRSTYPYQGWINGSSGGQRELQFVSEDNLYKFTVSYEKGAQVYEMKYSVNQRNDANDPFNTNFYSIPIPNWLIPPTP